MLSGNFSEDENNIFNLRSENEFEKTALQVFRLQANKNSVYGNYISQLNIRPEEVTSLQQIPFLPIEFFKSEKVVTGIGEPERIFISSGTTGSEHSKHFVNRISLYENSFLKCFELFYGNPEEYCILALLPSYLERTDSSLVFMMSDLIKRSNHPNSGFYLHNLDDLRSTLLHLQKGKQKTMLTGVTYALIDLIEHSSFHFPELIVMETGGMKGKRRELIREELHDILSKNFGVHKIHSEYGMTELLSQAYSKGKGIFKSPPWMQILIRDTNDPMTILGKSQTGGINVIDLANIHSCSFIATQDLGKVYDDGSFEVLGRFDLSDIRGCNLMME